jgi:phosphate starvation-inducible protein PhoH
MQQRQRVTSKSKEKRRAKRDAVQHIQNSKFAMREITPITDTQEDLFDSYNQGFHIAAVGTAGTGKTLCAMYLALNDVLTNRNFNKVIIVRSAVQTREQGHMPGTKEQKEALYSAPYADIANDLFERGDAWQILQTKRQVEFITTSFVRGLTFDNAIIIVDECQSMTYHELDTVITRVGESSKIIFCGDTRQDDLKSSRNRADVSGLAHFLNVLDKMESFDTVEFTPEDIVRSGLVKEYILAKEALPSQV